MRKIQDSKCWAMYLEGINFGVDPMGHALVGSSKRRVL